MKTLDTDTKRNIVVVLIALFLLSLLSAACNHTSGNTSPEIVVTYAGEQHFTIEGDTWSLYSVSNGTNQSLYKQERFIPGSSVKYDAETLYIELGYNYQLANVENPIKVQGMNYEDLRYRTPSNIFYTTYQGYELEINVGKFEYFVIQVQLQSK